MKSTKVQILGAVTSHATTACTDDISIADCLYHANALLQPLEVFQLPVAAAG